MGVLSEGEAVDLLAATAGIAEGAALSSESEGARAREVVNLCGRLALTVSIAGGMISASGGSIDEEFMHLVRKIKMRDNPNDDVNVANVMRRIVWLIKCSIKPGEKLHSKRLALERPDLFAELLAFAARARERRQPQNHRQSVSHNYHITCDAS